MRSHDEMMKLILDRAKNDERIRAVYMQGSRIDPNATHDKYSDYDIVYIVRDIRSFTNNEKWIDYFGERLILQKPDDWYSHPYDYNSNHKFAYLIQFKDGNRIDLTLIDMENLQDVHNDTEPRKILLVKDEIRDLNDIKVDNYYNIQKPSGKEYFDCCNEFWWLSIYVAKGLCRKELLYAKFFMEHYQMEMFFKMLDWSIGIKNDFSVSTGKCHKYLKRYLSKEEMDSLTDIFPDGDYKKIWDKLFKMCDFFNELALKVSNYFGYYYDTKEVDEITKYLKCMQIEMGVL